MILSIIVPVYNVEPYVGPCIGSIYDESANEESFEVIVVNDGSTDGSGAVVSDCASRYRNTQVITQENQGLSMARMNGLARAKGDYVWFVDSDDLLKPGAVDTVLRLIRENKDIDVFMTPIHREDRSSDDYTLNVPFLSCGINVLFNHRFPVFSVYRYIIRRSLFDHKSLFFPRGLLHEDEYFGRVLLALANRVYVGNESVYFYRMRADSIMRTATIRSSYDYLSNYSLLKDFSKTLPKADQGRFLVHSQRILTYSYTINEPNWSSPEFRRFKCKKSPYIIQEYLRNARNYSFRELAGLLLLTIAPNTFRRRYPA